KDFYMEVRKSLNRFLSIFLIVALGVAFFAGIRATQPDMQMSADAFYDQSKLMDIRVLGDLGMTEADQNELMKIDGVKHVMASHTQDVLCDTESAQLVLKMMSVPDELNLITILEGRLPEQSGECLADHEFIETTGYQIGDSFTVKSGSEDATEDLLHQDTYTIVGVGSTSYYLSFDRGSSSIGSGDINSFIIIMPEDFVSDVYSELYISVKGADTLLSYSDEYDALIENVTDQIEAMADVRCEIRYQDVVTEANEKIADGEEQIVDGEKKIADAETELADAKQELDDGKTKIEDGEAELADGKKKLAEHEQDVIDGEQELADAWQELIDGKQELEDGRAELDENWKKSADGREEVMRNKQKLKDGEAELETAKKTLAEKEEQLNAGEQQLLAEEQKLNQNQTILEQLGKWDQAQAELAAKKAELSAGRDELGRAKQTIAEKEVEIGMGWDKIHQAEYDIIYGEQDLAEAEQEWLDGKQEYEDGLQEYEDGKQELADGKVKIADAKIDIAEAEQKIADAKVEYEDGLKKYEDAKEEADVKLTDAKADIAKAKTDIADAKKQVADLEIPEWYVLDRSYIQTYVEYGQDADRIGAIGEVFPLIFFLVAALVSLTTMTRMVEEERTQIGTLKALGYSNLSIAAKYLVYALLASLLGSLFGLVAGQKILPPTIINAYAIMYDNLPVVVAPLNLRYSVTSTAAAVLCTTLATLLACYKELLAAPAVLMRPAAPKAGKRVLLERVTFIWKHLSFTQKSTIRNLIRYRKRFFMTVFGIGGCMALLLVGFGLKDSINAIGELQFGVIRIYDADITIEDDATEEEKEELYRTLQADQRVTGQMYGEQLAIDIRANDITKSGYLVIPENQDEMPDYINFRNRVTHESYSMNDEGVIMTEKLATLLGVKKGDTITLKEDDTSEIQVEVSEVTENYFNHYIYMSKVLYEKLFHKPVEYSQIFLKNTQNEEAFETAMGTYYMELESVAGITFYSGMAERIKNMLKSMDTIIWVLVISAALLAFVVLYNLNNINVNERKRELATLKVLGFYDGEVSSYVNRENVLLTLLGAVAGIFLGMILHYFVIMTAEIDIMMFGRDIKPVSYVYSVLLTFAFSLIVNFVMYFRLKRIDMIESLKSVE
ncbi:MAG: FtsX-like permease family protein, partial [bacterium]|nr:FtsX-like permease family protein [bacterium]